MKKRIIAVLLAAATAITTTACKAPAGQESTGAEKTESAVPAENGSMKTDPVTIHYFGHANSNGANEQIISDFQKEYPWITVELVDLPNDTAQKLSTISTILQAKDSSIDVMVMDGTWTTNFMSAGWLEPLTGKITDEQLGTYVDGAISGCYLGDELYALPFYLNVSSLLYRKDLLDKYGFEPAKTWDELIEQCRVITAGEENMSGFTAAWKQNESLTCTGLEYVWAFGGDVLDEKGTCIINSNETKAGLKMMKRLVDEGITVEGITGFTSADMRAPFYAGNVVYARDWATGYVGATDEKQSGIADQVGIAPLPGGKDQDTNYNCSGGWNMGVSAFSEHKEEAELFAAYACGYDANVTQTSMNGDIPTNLEVLKSEKVLEARPYMAELAEMTAKCKNRPSSPYYEEVSAAFQNGVGNYLAGNVELDPMLEEMQKTIDEIMSR